MPQRSGHPFARWSSTILLAILIVVGLWRLLDRDSDRIKQQFDEAEQRQQQRHKDVILEIQKARNPQPKSTDGFVPAKPLKPNLTDPPQ